MKTVAQIVQVKESVEDKLLKQPGVTGVDVGYKYVDGKRTDQIAIRVLVAKKKKTVPKGQEVPKTIDGVKTDVIERKYELQQFKNRKKVEDVELLVDAGRYRPLNGGMGIGPCRVVGGFVFVGTLGAIVKDNATGNPFCLSNFHVMCIDNGSHVGDQMCQPGRVDGGSCPADVVGSLQRSSLAATVDCAVCDIAAGIGYVCEVLEIGQVAGTAVAVLDAPVRKRGRTTGLTYGFVDGIHASVNIDYGDGIGMRTLTNQVSIRPDTAHNALFSDHGDSGSVIMDANRNVMSLLFAGSSDGHTLGNPIADVLSALNVNMCVGTKAPLKDIKDHKVEFKEIKDKDTKPETKELKIEKNEIKEHKEIKDKDTKPETKELKIEKNEIKEHKEIKDKDKIEIKEHIKEKIEIKEHIKDKIEIKEHKIEKSEIDIGPKTIGDGPPKISEGPSLPIPNAPGSGGMEARLAQLESTVSQLATFITAAMRPDLSVGALKQEQDLTALSKQLQLEAAQAAQIKTQGGCGC
jgi:hypothetical protein